MTASGGRRANDGFTLLEVMAVVLLLALVAAVALPALGRSPGAEAERDAEELAAAIEVARRASLATRRDHRLVLDLREASWWLESREEERLDFANGDVPEPGSLPVWGDLEDLPLVAPVEARHDFRPMPGLVGQGNVLRSGVFFGGAETASGWVEDGRIHVALHADGGADAVRVLLVTADGERVWLDVDGVRDRIGIHREAG